MKKLFVVCVLALGLTLAGCSESKVSDVVDTDSVEVLLDSISVDTTKVGDVKVDSAVVKADSLKK